MLPDYGNNTSFLKELERKKLKYIGGIAKIRNISVKIKSKELEKIRVDEYAKWLSSEKFKEIKIKGEKSRTVWVAIIEVEISQLECQRKIAIVMSAPVFEEAEDIDYLITNVEGEIVTEQWIINTYSERNWIEVFDRKAKEWLGLKEYQFRDKRSLEKHFILVFCAYTFMRTRILRFPQNREMSVLWHQLTGELRRRWAKKPLNTLGQDISTNYASHSTDILELY